jgi:hypothetical protein
MTRNSGKLGHENVPSRPLPDYDTEAEANEKGWATATRRVLLYLKALGVPPRDSLRLAEEALVCAEREQDSPPVQAAMTALRSQVLPGGAPVGLSPGWASVGTLPSRPPMGVPPVRPGRMTPARIDRRPWLTFLLRCAQRSRSFLRKGRRGQEAGRQRSLQTRSKGPRKKEERLRGP